MKATSLPIPVRWAHFKRGSPIFEGLMGLAKHYYRGAVTTQEARKVLASLGKGQPDWIQKVLVAFCKGKRKKSQLYHLGLCQSHPVTLGDDVYNREYTSVTLHETEGGGWSYGLGLGELKRVYGGSEFQESKCGYIGKN